MSNSNTAIRAKDICKIYRIGMKQEIHDSLLRALLAFVKSPLRNYSKYRSLYNFDDVLSNSGSPSGGSLNNVIWALEDVSFEVKKGERIGIIGRNGAGKSTLLKILSRITAPTKGIAEIRGRVSSLLEVGTGFHPELTGRENVYLNGTVLGMRKYEVDHKFDQIVDFANINKFIDTPVKRYSSGMKVRLAFSVAAHLEPEILIVDEVLAVGDAAFQKKCLNKMEDAGEEGRTVVFVSHNMEAITRLCDRAILIEEGRVITDGPSNTVVSQYLCSELGTTAARKWHKDKKAPGNAIVRLRSARILDKDKNVVEALDIRKPVLFEMTYDVLRSGYKLLPHFCVNDSKNTSIFVTVDQDKTWRNKIRPVGRYTNTALVPGNFFSEGLISVDCSMRTLDPEMFVFDVPSAVTFNIIDSLDGDSARGDYTKNMPGIIRPKLEWETTYEPG